MRVLLVLAAVAAVLVLLSQVRLGIRLEYGTPGLRVRLKLGPVQLRVYPRSSGKKAKKTKRKKTKGPPEQGGGSLGQLQRFLPLVAEAAGRLRRAARVDRFYLDVTAGAADPASAALAFGGVNAAVGMLWPIVEQNVSVRDRRIRTRVDFGAGRTTAELRVDATLTAGQTLALGLRLLRRAASLLSAGKAGKKSGAQTRKEAV